MHPLISRREDANHFRSMGLNADINNNLVLENIPEIALPTASNSIPTTNTNRLKED